MLYIIAALTAKQRDDDRVLAPCQEARRLTVRSDTIILRRKSNLYQSKGAMIICQAPIFTLWTKLAMNPFIQSIVNESLNYPQFCTLKSFFLLNILKKPFQSQT